MKLLNKLLPVATITSIAGIAVSLISCSKGNNVTDEYTPICIQDTTLKNVLKTEEMHFELSTTYKVTFLWSDALKIGAKDQPNGWLLGSASKDFSKNNAIESDTFKVYLNDVLITDKINCNDGSLCPNEKLNLNDNMRFKIDFAIASDRLFAPIGCVCLMATPSPI